MPPDTIAETLGKLIISGCNYEAYTTFGATEGKQKSRLLIPIAEPLTCDEYTNFQGVLCDQLREQIGVIADNSARGPVQIAFLPNAGGGYYRSLHHREGNQFNPKIAWAGKIANPKLSTPTAPASAIAIGPPLARDCDVNGLATIDAVKMLWPPASIAQAYGYELSQCGKKLRRPGGNEFKVAIEDGEKLKTWGENDPLNNRGNSCDSFDVLRILGAVGDESRGLALAEIWISAAKGGKFPSPGCDPTVIFAHGATPPPPLATVPPMLERGDHLSLARAIVTKIGAENLISIDDGSMWHWRGASWERVHDTSMGQQIQETFASLKLTSAIVASVLGMVRTDAFKQGHRFNKSAEDSIYVANGRLSPYGCTWTLSEPRREDYRTIRIPVAFDPNATAPRFTQYLNEIFAGTEDINARIALVQEAFGYSMIASCHLEKFFLLIGEGCNGKSVMLNILAELLGPEQISTVRAGELSNRFKLAHMAGKLANIPAEIKEGEQVSDDILKTLVSGDRVNAEFKGRDAFDFVPTATLWFSTNHMPRTQDHSTAFFRRTVIVSFPNAINPAMLDVHLSDKLKAELPGILNFALVGLSRLLDRKKFTIPPSSVIAIDKWKYDADPVRQFVDECTRPDLAVSWPINDLYAHYRTWALQSGHHPLAKRGFGDRLEKLGFPRSRTENARLIAGLSLILPFR